MALIEVCCCTGIKMHSELLLARMGEKLRMKNKGGEKNQKWGIDEWQFIKRREQNEGGEKCGK